MNLRLVAASGTVRPTTKALLHFGDVVIPSMNDFIYRRRLLHFNWKARHSALTRILEQARFGTSPILSQSTYEVWRDQQLIFRSSDQLLPLLEEELTLLPQNQTSSLTEKYCAIMMLNEHMKNQARVSYNSDFEQSTFESLTAQIAALQQQVRTDCPKISVGWSSFKIECEGEFKGPRFWAPSKSVAEKFLEYVRTGTEDHHYQGLAALGYTDPDPMMRSHERKIKEAKLIGAIMGAERLQEVMAQQAQEKSDPEQEVGTDPYE